MGNFIFCAVYWLAWKWEEISSWSAETLQLSVFIDGLAVHWVSRSFLIFKSVSLGNHIWKNRDVFVMLFSFSFQVFILPISQSLGGVMENLRKCWKLRKHEIFLNLKQICNKTFYNEFWKMLSFSLNFHIRWGFENALWQNICSANLPVDDEQCLNCCWT